MATTDAQHIHLKATHLSAMVIKSFALLTIEITACVNIPLMNCHPLLPV
jgi:hypothetical protein